MSTYNVLLCCGAGMSSGFLAQKTQKAADSKGYDMNVEAKSSSVVEDVVEDFDVLLLGPHYLSHLADYEEIAKPYGIPVAVIPQEIYGTLDGERLVEFAMNILSKK